MVNLPDKSSAMFAVVKKNKHNQRAYASRDKLISLIALALLLSAAAADLFVHFHGAQSRGTQASTLTAADSKVVALRTEASSVRSRYLEDYENEGFFRRYLWRDSSKVKADEVSFNVVEKQYEAAQKYSCVLRAQNDCRMHTMTLRTHADNTGLDSRTSTILHRVFIVAIVVALLMFLALVRGLVIILTYTPTLPISIVLIILTIWWIFH